MVRENARRLATLFWLLLIWVGMGIGIGAGKVAGAESRVSPELQVRYSARTWTNQAGGILRYRWFDPVVSNGVERLPLVVILHGAVGRGDDNVKQFSGGNQVPALALTERTVQARYRSYVMMPQCPRGENWSVQGAGKTSAIRGVLEFVETYPNRHGIDTNRIYLVGLSMGGAGTWSLGAERPGLFAALVPICGSGDPGWAERLKDTPVWCFHGDADPLVNVRYAREMVDALKGVGAKPRYTEYPGVGHGSYEPAFREKELLPWIFGQERSRGQLR